MEVKNPRTAMEQKVGSKKKKTEMIILKIYNNYSLQLQSYFCSPWLLKKCFKP